MTKRVDDFEKMWAFYLGRTFDWKQGRVTDDLLLYDSKDLTTHAVCLGMTGSGKTGLCVALLEEAAIDGVPALAIDPKGDLANLFLSFPQLRPEDFQPWVDPDAAAREGLTVDQAAARAAQTWRKGLGEWGQDADRIARLHASCELALYTPGMSGGRPLRVLRSLAAPPQEQIDDTDALRERMQGTVSSLLSLLGIEADPIRSREHILVTNILDRAWRAGRDLDIGELIGEIQSPPFDKLGIMDLETFYPSKDRFELAMALNGLLASPGFGAWMEGEPLDIGQLLYTNEGRPKLSILSIAHLSESERMFFVSLLLNEVVAWVRRQPGTSSLRAILYMDEVYGYFPPSANPPSKAPMLTLLKQARAQGLGVVLATQNPVDLDYKGLSNMGTWFLGRLQTERDKQRVLDGLDSASASTGAAFDRGEMDRLLSSLKGRVFVLNNVHEDHPEVFNTRWCLSYLRGPLHGDEIRRLAQESAETATAQTPQAPRPSTEKLSHKERSPGGESPVLAPEIPQVHLEARHAVSAGSELVYRPALLGTVQVHYANRNSNVDLWRTIVLVRALDDSLGPNPWEQAQTLEGPTPLAGQGLSDARYLTVPPVARRPKSYSGWAKRLKTSVYRTHPLTLWHCPQLKAYSQPDQSEGEFRAALRQRLHERRDLELERLRQRYAPKLKRLEERIRQAELRLDREQDQHKQEQLQTAISLGATILGALFGRKTVSAGTIGRSATTARKAGRIVREAGDVERAQARLEELQEQLHALDAEFADARTALIDELDEDGLEVREVLVRTRKTDTTVEEVVLAWLPWSVDENGIAEPIY